MPRPCTCDRYRPGEDFDAQKDCRLCWLYHNRKDYRMHWDGVSGPFFYGWLLLAEDERDVSNWRQVACETTEAAAREETKRERQRTGAIRGMVTKHGMNPAEPAVWLGDTAHSPESLIDRLARLGSSEPAGLPSTGETSMSPKNDVLDFIFAETSALQAEYERVQKRTTEDPGTAGDQGEENWAEILRKWLPVEYHVVTKGRILGHTDEASPQVDVIILSPSYPPHLLNKKLYLAGGIAAAFECKLTLKAKDIKDTVDNCTKIKRLVQPRLGTPYLELNTPLLYGLLAHSHVWQGAKSAPLENVGKTLHEANLACVKHPRELLDLICIADLASWTVSKNFAHPMRLPPLPDNSEQVLKEHRAIIKASEGKCGACYPHYCNTCTCCGRVATRPILAPIGELFLALMKKLAWEDCRLRRLADYFSLVSNPNRAGMVSQNSWMSWEFSAVLSRSVRECIEKGDWTIMKQGDNVFGTPHGLWNEWFPLSDCHQNEARGQ